MPTKGAIIPARFVTQIGGRALITLKNLENQPVPFGALATLEERQTGIAGVVGDSGQVYFSGLQEEGELSVKWGPSLSQQCRAAYRLPENKELSGIYLLTAVCR
ncbi:FimD/PapC C-terminal domain-containing protein [Erwinia sp. E_sp_B01_9]